MRFIMPLILIGIAISVFFMFANPIYNEISGLRVEVASYNEALDNSKALENERDKLTAKYNSINPDNLTKLQKFLPDSIDNIRLILEIEKIALPYGMALKDVRYDTVQKKSIETGGGVTQAGMVQIAEGANINRDYGVWNLEFSIQGSYNDFINFTKDLENNLRIVDISSIDFTSSNTQSGGAVTESYKYNFKIKTYWLKN